MFKLSLMTAYKLGDLVRMKNEVKSVLFPKEMDYVTNYDGATAIVFKEEFQKSKFDSAKMMKAVGKLDLISLYDSRKDEVVIYNKKADLSKKCGCHSIGPPHNEKNGFIGIYDSHPGQILVRDERDLENLKVMESYIKLVNEN